VKINALLEEQRKVAELRKFLAEIYNSSGTTGAPG
jgi:hypothetical protein